jgi:hypothetical protein
MSRKAVLLDVQDKIQFLTDSIFVRRHILYLLKNIMECFNEIRAKIPIFNRLYLCVKRPILYLLKNIMECFNEIRAKWDQNPIFNRLYLCVRRPILYLLKNIMEWFKEIRAKWDSFGSAIYMKNYRIINFIMLNVPSSDNPTSKERVARDYFFPIDFLFSKSRTPLTTC